jgi:hypothetical protein
MTRGVMVPAEGECLREGKTSQRATFFAHYSP